MEMQVDKFRRSVHMIEGRKTPYNSTFAIGGVSCSADSFVVTESAVLRMNICAEKPAHRKSAKRYAQCKKTTDNSKLNN